MRISSKMPLALALAATALIACGGNDGTNDASAPLDASFPASDGGTGAISDGGAGENADAGPVPSVGEAVFLYTGSNGGGPSSDLYVSDVEATYRDASFTVEVGATVPSDLADRFRLFALLNPRDELPQSVIDAAVAFVERGGRVLFVMEHCKNGCWGNADQANRLLAAMGSTMRMSGQGGAPLSNTSLDLTPVAPLTDGVSSLVVFYSGSVAVGSGTPLGRLHGGDVVVGHEALGIGSVAVIADSSMLGYVLSEGDNRRFLTNLAR